MNILFKSYISIHFYYFILYQNLPLLLIPGRPSTKKRLQSNNQEPRIIFQPLRETGNVICAGGGGVEGMINTKSPSFLLLLGENL